jgi:cytochrome c553
MKNLSLRLVFFQLALLLAAAAVFFSMLGGVGASAAGVLRESIRAKINYCKDCHGLSAQGFRGYYPIPRLAGQQPQYLRNQLRAFVERSRPNPIMSNVAHVLSPAMIDAITTYFEHFNPPPAGRGPSWLVAEGKSIFQDGVPQDNVAACAACHGPNATGQGEIPRLAGQLYPYVVKRRRPPIPHSS